MADGVPLLPLRGGASAAVSGADSGSSASASGASATDIRIAETARADAGGGSPLAAVAAQQSAARGSPRRAASPSSPTTSCRTQQYHTQHMQGGGCTLAAGTSQDVSVSVSLRGLSKACMRRNSSLAVASETGGGGSPAIE